MSDDSMKRWLFQALTGALDAQVNEQKATTDLAATLKSLGGRSRRSKSGINLTAAAKALGTSTTTLRRWLNGSQTPSAKNTAKLRKAVRAQTSTKRGRAAAMKRHRPPPAKRGYVMKVEAMQGPHRKSGHTGLMEHYWRMRLTQIHLTADEYAHLQNAWVNQGEGAATDYMQSLWDREYAPDWTFSTSEVRGVSFQ